MLNAKFRSNPYVYPSIQFADLGNKVFFNNLLDEASVTSDDLIELISQIKKPVISISGETINEKVLSIFLDEKIRFGPKNFIKNQTSYWNSKLDIFTSKNLPIQFTLLGFPCKVPVPLKTNRTLPDMGELLVLKRLKDISTIVGEVYKPGAVINVFTEGVFGKFNNIPTPEYRIYEQKVKAYGSLMGWEDRLRFIRLESLEEMASDFNERFEEKIKLLKKMHKEKDPEFTEKFEKVFEPQYRIMNTKILNLSDEELMDVYNDKLPNDKISKKTQTVRNDITERVKEKIYKYFAYLSVRDDVDFINKCVPNAITLSVSPKPNRLGIIPINRESTRLPHHGVPVYHVESDTWTIEYLIDIKRMNKKYTPMVWNQDSERLPFFYREEE